MDGRQLFLPFSPCASKNRHAANTRAAEKDSFLMLYFLLGLGGLSTVLFKGKTTDVAGNAIKYDNGTSQPLTSIPTNARCRLRAALRAQLPSRRTTNARHEKSVLPLAHSLPPRLPLPWVLMAHLSYLRYLPLGTALPAQQRLPS